MRDICFHFKATKAEYRAIQVIAAQEGLNLSEATRLAIREAAKSRGLGPLAMLVPRQGPCKQAIQETENERQAA